MLNKHKTPGKMTQLMEGEFQNKLEKEDTLTPPCLTINECVAYIIKKGI